jgi:hypothetical protein
MRLDVFAECFNLALIHVYGDWGWRKHSPVDCRSWPGFKREMARMCRDSHLRPECFAMTDRPERRGAFGNQWGI